MMNNQLHELGLEMRKRVLGAEHVEKALAAADQHTQPLQDIVNEFCWGAVWARPGLEPRIRSMLTVTMLTALNRSQELRTHMRGALNNGVTREEIGEIITHLAFYAGWPSAMTAGTIARRIFDARKP
jgi:4-carboxymuconolactone decarboxylase